MTTGLEVAENYWKSKAGKHDLAKMIQDALAEARNETKPPELPQPVAVPDLGVLRGVCGRFVEFLCKGTIPPSEITTRKVMIFEAAMETIYGKTIWADLAEAMGK